MDFKTLPVGKQIEVLDRYLRAHNTENIKDTVMQLMIDMDTNTIRECMKNCVHKILQNKDTKSVIRA